MHWCRCVLAEWQLLRARLVRSRLGIWLLLLDAGTVWLATRGVPLGLLAPHVAMLGAVLGVAFTVGSEADRAALALTLTHPTTPLAVAAGRWLAAVTAAAMVVLACTCVAAPLASLSPGALARVAAGGLGAAGGAAGCALVAAARGGNALTAVLFLYIAVPSLVPADALSAAPAPGVLTRIGGLVLELFPGVWRYGALAAGDPVGWAHAACWVVGGIAGTARVLTSRAR